MMTSPGRPKTAHLPTEAPLWGATNVVSVGGH
jgi:hypothetical protein